MIETLTIPLLLVIAGLICVVLAIIGKISGKIEIIILPERQRILGGVGVVFLVIGLALGVIIQPTPPDEGITPTPTSPITPTPTPSPTATLTPTSPPEITVKITNPKNGSSVPLENTVSGTASNVPDNLYLWVLVFPPNNRWYPNQGRISIFEDGWMMTALVGSPDDSGKKFYIYAVLADEQADKEFQNYMDTCEETKSWPGMSSLPKGAKIYNRIMVIRE